MKKIGIILIIVSVLVIGFIAFEMTGNILGSRNGTKVKFETSKGDIVIQMYSQMPITSGNFVK